MHGPASGSRPPAPIASWAAGVAGVLAVIVGTFLPWVVSGSVRRNLYTVAGAADRIGLLGQGAPIADWLPLIGPLCVVPVLLAVLGLRRIAAGWALALAVVCGGSAGAVLVLAVGRAVAGIHLDAAGPVTVVAGALLLAAGALGQLAGARRRGPMGGPGDAHPQQAQFQESGTPDLPRDSD